MAENLKLENFSDREILHLLADLADNEGWVDVEALAIRVGLSRNGLSEAQMALHVRRCVTVRLAWIKKLSGCVERHPDKKVYAWRLTDLGREIVSAKLSKEVADKLGNIQDGATLLALSTLARRFTRSTPAGANLMRREWTHGTHRNRRG